MCMLCFRTTRMCIQCLVAAKICIWYFSRILKYWKYFLFYFTSQATTVINRWIGWEDVTISGINVVIPTNGVITMIIISSGKTRETTGRTEIGISGATSVGFLFNNPSSLIVVSPVGWGCRIHRLHLCRGVRLPPTSVLDMTLNYLIMKLQSWNFGKCGVPVCCHYSQVHSDPEL